MKQMKTIKEEILARVNIEQECEMMGIRFAGPISASGWRPCHNPYKRDEVASCGIYMGQGPWRGYFVAHNDIGQDGKIRRASSFFDMAADFLPGMCGDFKVVFGHYAKLTGVRSNSYRPPTRGMLERYIRGLTNDVREYLHSKRGLTDETIEKHKIGWSLRKERNVIPVYDAEGNLVNFRYHNSKKKPKTLNLAGYGDARLWGVDRLIQAPQGSIVCITEGEWDAMLVEQETGFLTVSPTNGAKAFLTEWVEYFHGQQVVLVWDCDQEGRKAVQKLVLPAFRRAISNGDIPSITIIWLYEKATKNEKDFTDFIMKSGGSGDRLMEMIEFAAPHEYVMPSTALPDPVTLQSFSEVNNDKYAGQRITVPLYVFGENSEAYHAPTEIEVTHCELCDQSKCHGREDWDWLCEDPIGVKMGDRIQLASIRASDAQLRGSLREFVCDRNKRPAVTVRDDKRVTLTEVYAHQALEGNDSSEANELIEKPVYVIGGKPVPIGKYQATGFVHTLPRDQRPTMLIDTIEQQAEDWQAFDTDKVRPLLRALKEVDPVDLLKDLVNVTRIYERDDLHLATLLNLCSPRWINMPGEGKIRGWVSCIVVGDTGTGKTSVSETLYDYANVGYRVSGMTSSRTGITYACEFNEKRGWRVKAGALLKMSKQALIVDETQDLHEEDLKTMAEAIDTGQLRIARIETRTFESETRVLFICNPKAPDRKANQRTMDTFRYGCQALQDIYPSMMIRRIDLCLFVTSYDIEDKSKIYNPGTTNGAQWMSAERLRALIYFAWNLTPDQVIISREMSDLIRQEALKLSEKFGGCAADLPIVYPEDFRKTFCRLVTALVVIDLASDDDFQTIVVNEDHVNFMAEFIDTIYSADNCRLNEYSRRYIEEHTLTDPGGLFHEIDKVKFEATNDEWKRMVFMLDELLKLDPMGREKISQKFFSDYLDVTRQTINRDMTHFVKRKLVDTSRGYRPTNRLIRLNTYIEKYHPDFWGDKS